MKRKRKSEYWTKRIKYPTVPDVDLRLYLRLERGKPKRFCLVFKHKIGGAFKNIKRCDNSAKHKGIPHCHIYKMKAKTHREIISDVDPNLGIMIQSLITDIRNNVDKIVENYKYSN